MYHIYTNSSDAPMLICSDIGTAVDAANAWADKGETVRLVVVHEHELPEQTWRLNDD